mmetsp:Transcript_102011/g.327303  ORF Transcript_102011/g.327303 Transcript_102011/m.327303 type:complete len:203 (-) Transcript_102011:2209-2817(-)
MRLHGDGAIAHRPRAEALHDLAGRLHCLQGDGCAAILPGRLEVKLASQRGALHQTVVQRCKGCVGCAGVRPGGLLKLGDDHRVIDVLLDFRALAPVIQSEVRQSCEDRGVGLQGEAAIMQRQYSLCDLFEAVAAQLARDAVEANGDHLLAQADRIGDLCTLVAVQRGDAHLGHDLQEALADSLLIGVMHLRWVGDLAVIDEL